MLKWGWNTLLIWDLAWQTEFLHPLINTEMVWESYSENNHGGYAVTIPPCIDEETEIQEGSLVWSGTSQLVRAEKEQYIHPLAPTETGPWIPLQKFRVHPNLAAERAINDLWVFFQVVGRMGWRPCSRQGRGRKAWVREASREMLRQGEACNEQWKVVF